MARFAFQRLGPLLVVVTGTEAPTDDEWQRYLGACVDIDREYGGFGLASAFILTDGGVPTGAQLVALDKVLQRRPGASAVVCDAASIRLIMGFMGLINPALRVFPSRSWRQAATFAGIDESRLAEVLALAEALGQEIGDVQVLRAIRADAG